MSPDEPHVSSPQGTTGDEGSEENTTVPAARAAGEPGPTRPQPRGPIRRRQWLSPNNIIGALIVVIVGSLVTVVATSLWSTWFPDGEDNAVTRVLAWAPGQVKDGPVDGARVVTTVKPGNYYTAECWTPGDKVSYQVYRNDKWIRLKLPDDRIGYASAIFFKGNDQAGVPNQC